MKKEKWTYRYTGQYNKLITIDYKWRVSYDLYLISII